MKIWRIAFISGGITAIGLLLFFMYQIFILDNTGVVDRLNSQYGSAPLALLGFILYVFIFIVVLVTFPSFLFLSLPWAFLFIGLLTEGKAYMKKLNNFYIISLGISSILLILVVRVMYAVQNT